MKKVIILIIALVLIAPFIPKLLPKPMTTERIVAGLKAAGFTVTDPVEESSPMYESIQQWNLQVNGVQVGLYLYNDEGLIVKNVEYQRPDAGTAIAESMNLRAALGAAKDPNLPVFVCRKKMFMALARTEDKALGQKIISTISGL